MLRAFASLILFLFTVSAMAETPPSNVIKELAPTGHLRAAINFGNPVLAQRDIVTGEPRGVSAELARGLAARLGVPVDFVTFETAGKVFEALKSGAWDVAFLAIDPVRATEIDFTAPYVIIEGTYAVPEGSPFQSTAELDREGVRIAAGLGTAYDLYLTRALKSAELVRSPTSESAQAMFLKDQLDAVAGVRQALITFAAEHPGIRVLPDRFMAIEQAMGTPKGRDAGALYLREFMEDMKSSGFVANALSASGQDGAMVAAAPPSR